METKEITDINSINKMVETLFKQFPVYTILEKKPVQIKILAIKNQNVIIQSPEENPNPIERILLLTNSGNLLQFRFKVTAKDPRGIEILQPNSLTIKTATRINTRIQVSKAPIQISKIISQNMIPHDLAYIQKLKVKFTDVVFFIHERMDIRMRLLVDSGKHLFVPDTKSPDSVGENFIPYSEYMHLAKSTKDSQKYFSEICVPLKFKNIFPFGYLQILHTEKTNINDYNLVLHAANKLCNEIEESDVFNYSKHVSNIMDISSTGLSFAHPQSKHFGKLFSIGSIILFEMYEYDKSIGTFRAVVRNIKPLEKLFRIGCQFFHTAEEDKTIEVLMEKHFPESFKELELKKANFENSNDKPKTKVDSVLESLTDEEKPKDEAGTEENTEEDSTESNLPDPKEQT